MNQVFLDTGYVLALELSNDQKHHAVTDHWRRLATGVLPSLVTTSYVFCEIVTFFNARGHHGKAVEVGNNLLQSRAIEIVHVDEELLELSWHYLASRQDKRYSLTDCASFVVMKRRGISTAFTVDHHFEQAGFQIQP
jgi:hypothetical protein